MLIESIIKRAKVTSVTLDDKTYRFLPDSKDRHVAEVTDKDHIKRLLDIEEGYREASDDAEPVQQLTPEEKDKVTERASLAAEFEEKFGRKPAKNISIEKLREALAEGTGV